MSGETNGNGMKPVAIDVTDEHAFKTGVVQTLQLISDNTACLPSLKKKVDRHEQVYQTGKYVAVPALAFLHAAFKSFFQKLGW